MERWCPLTVKLSPRSTAMIAAPGVGATARLFPYMGWSSAIGKEVASRAAESCAGRLGTRLGVVPGRQSAAPSDSKVL
ncbi:hypothetical protein Tco_0882890 [Tanacetum coccineum]